MILAQRKENEVKIEGVISDIKMSLDMDSTAHLMMLLSTNLYQNPIATPLQEICSNSLDSHVEAGVNEPILVSLTKENNGQWTFSSEDFGLGLDNDDFHNIMSKYGKSTKRENSEVLGMLGIGSKSFFAYTDSYTYICRKNNVERMYIMRKDEVGFAINMIYEKPTEEKNGVKVIVPVNSLDVYDFHKAMTSKLAYFENVYFHSDYTEIDNNFKIYENENFKYSTLSDSSEMTILLGRINYKLDFNALGLTKPIYFPIALKFGLSDGIYPSPNREQIILSKEAKDKILNKIKLVADYFVQKYNNDLTEMTNVDDVYNYYQYSDKIVNFADEKFRLKEILKYSEFKLAEPTFKGISKLKLGTLHNNYSKFLQNYTTRAEISSGRFTTKNILSSGNITNCVKDGGKVILCNNELPNKKTVDFIKDTIGDCIFVKKAHQFTLGSISGTWGWRDNEFMGILELKKYHKSDWRQVISEYLSVVKQYEDKLIPIESIQITKEWEESRKKARKVAVQTTRKQKLEGEINFKLAERVDRSCDWSCKFVSEVINLKDFHKRKGIIVYGLEEQRKKLDDLFNIYYRTSKNKVIAAIVGQRDYEKLKNVKLHNLMTIEEFESDYNKPIARYVTAYKINKFYVENKELFNNVNFIKDNLNKDLGECLKELNNYRDNYNNTDNSLMISLVTFCDKNKYYDYPIYQTLKEVEKECAKLNFLKFFVASDRYYNKSINKEAVPIIQELLRARKFRMDWEHYLTKEVPVQEEELVEQD